VIAALSTGYPGSESIVGPVNATIGRILGENGYARSWFGKNHDTCGCPQTPVQPPIYP
jgi:hypothetical protein